MDIQSISIWKEGKVYKVTQFNLRSVSDDLKSSATFYFELQAASQIVEGNETQSDIIAVGNLQMDGTDYTLWDGSNNMAYLWALNQLNLKPATA